MAEKVEPVYLVKPAKREAGMATATARVAREG
jgi:hypothetical protein